MRAILHCDNKWGIGKKNDLMFRPHIQTSTVYFVLVINYHDDKQP